MFIRQQTYRDSLRELGLDDLEGALAFPAQLGPPAKVPDWTRVSASSTSSVYRISGAGLPTLYLKQCRHVPPTGRYWFRPSRAWAESANLGLLSRLGISCGKVVCLGEQRQAGGGWLQKTLVLLSLAMIATGLAMWAVENSPAGRLRQLLDGVKLPADRVSLVGLAMVLVGAAIAWVMAVLAVASRLLRRDYLAGAALVTAGIEPSRNLMQFASDRWADRPRGDPRNAAEISAIARQLAKQVATIHRADFAHNDLKLRNLLACWPDGQQPRADNISLTWIDCPRGRRHWLGLGMTMAQKRDLAVLDRDARKFLSRAQRLRFLRDYLLALYGEAGLADLGPLARCILRRNRRRDAQAERRREHSGACP